MKSGARHQAGDVGFDMSGAGQKPSDELDLYQFFNAGCFSGYHDGPGGFYFVYNEVFSKASPDPPPLTLPGPPRFPSTLSHALSHVPPLDASACPRLQLAKEELAAHTARTRSSSSSSTSSAAPEPEFPEFGRSDWSYAQWRGFYDTWGSFSTLKTFSWADEYHAASGANRWQRRRMEEANEKARKKERREFNEQVRSGQRSRPRARF